MMFNWLLHPAVLVGVGCAVGGIARFYFGKGVNSQPWTNGFPFQTLLINIFGSLLLGILAELYLERKTSELRHELYLLFGTGFCGGFTTFSTFSLEILNLLRENSAFLALLYALASVILSLVGVWVGMKLTQAYV